MWCYSSFCAWLDFSPGKHSLLHKMLPTKQLLRKLACKYHLLSVTRDTWVLSAISALLPKMGPQLAAGELMESFKWKSWLCSHCTDNSCSTDNFHWYSWPQRTTRIKFGAEGMSDPALGRRQRDCQGDMSRGHSEEGRGYLIWKKEECG